MQIFLGLLWVLFLFGLLALACLITATWICGACVSVAALAFFLFPTLREYKVIVYPLGLITYACIIAAAALATVALQSWALGLATLPVLIALPIVSLFIIQSRSDRIRFWQRRQGGFEKLSLPSSAGLNKAVIRVFWVIFSLAFVIFLVIVIALILDGM
ncbi:MAG: hypothetical protein ACYS8W_17860 [Planctomycetota bacterium]|jgi:hypothetical protein